MDWDNLFSLANAAVLPGWAILVLGPRRIGWLMALPQAVIPLGLSLLYAALALGHMMTVPGGGFGSIGSVRALFLSDPVLLAGWVHYLAFDLAIGAWAAGRMDVAGVSRLIQAPVLVMVFMAGPLGLLLGALAIAAARLSPNLLTQRT
jgi:hypothetical protein